MNLRVIIALFSTLWVAACGKPSNGGGGGAGTDAGPGGCTDQCAEGARACDGNGTKVCEKEADGCRRWGEVTACGTGEVCDQGNCRKNCFEICSQGTSICDGSGVKYCELQANGCYDWGAPAACSANQVCSGGRCADSCVNQCTENARQCSGASVIECKRLSSGCTEWVNPTACASGQVCSAGSCVPGGQCTNQCTEGATKCTATGLQQSCVKLASGCTDWTLPAACPQGQTCPNSGTACTAVPCKAGDKRCNGTTVESCDAAANWVATQNCPQACQNGVCSAATTCVPGAVRCNGSNVEICNSSGTAWLYNQTCNVGCANGVCTDPCTPGDTRCNGKTPETCNAGGTGWAAGTGCTTSCYKGACVEVDLVIDGITKTLEGELVFQNGVVVKNGGQIKVGSTGKLLLRAKTVSIDAASSIVASGTGDDTRGSAPATSACCYYCGGSRCTTSGASAGYGTAGAGGGSVWVSYYCCWGCYNGCYAYATPGAAYDADNDTSISEGSKQGSDLGGGLVDIRAESVDLAGQITSNGFGLASGGGILIAADKVTGTGAIQAVGGSGPPAGGDGRVKLLRGSTYSHTGSATGKVVKSVMPPLDLVSGSHPDSTRWYNDGLGDLFIAWSKPFPTLNGYYYLISTSASDVPSPARGKFLQAESFAVPAAQLKQGSNYFHVVAVDSAFNVGTVEGTFGAMVNTQPPAVTSTSHPSERTWVQNNAIYLTWTNPKADANFTGYYYIFDHFADTAPTVTAGTFTTNKQLLLANVANGIWVFHLVNRDTRAATTLAAQHYTLYIGTEPLKGNLSGSVFDGSNASAPLPGVSIQINRGLFSSTTSTSGTYTFNNNLYEGTWEVTASKTGYVSQTRTVTVTAGQVTNQNFTLAK